MTTVNSTVNAGLSKGEIRSNTDRDGFWIENFRVRA